MKLNDRQIEHGFNYFFEDKREQIKSVVELAEYHGEDKFSINCTQLDYWLKEHNKKERDKKRILNEWCEFLQQNPTAFTELDFGTRMPQELFDAVCCQIHLKRLNIKWGAYKDLSAIENLTNMELLHIGSGASVESITPLTKLKMIVPYRFEPIGKYYARDRHQYYYGPGGKVIKEAGIELLFDESYRMV